MPGIVASAAYNFRMLQRVAYGGTNNSDHSGVKDLDFREIVTLVPLLVLVFWIGLHPQPFVDVMHASVQHLLTQASPAAAQASIVLP